ncbi:MAG: hypothetical protein ACJ76J_05445 [Thermoanaerobaculia bacterium]
MNNEIYTIRPIGIVRSELIRLEAAPRRTPDTKYNAGNAADPV